MYWPNWSLSEWAFLVSVIALLISIMALSTVFQMLWGRPSIQVDLDDCQVESNKALRCLIVNRPVQSRFLSLVGVTRQPTEIAGQLTVSEAGSGRIIAEAIRMHLTTEKEKGKQVTLTFFRPAVFLVAVYKDDGPSLLIDVTEQLDSPQNIKLERGRYRVTCTIYYSFNRVRKCAGEFVVGETTADFYWVEQQARILQ